MVTWSRVEEGHVIKIGVGFMYYLKVDPTGLADGLEIAYEGNMKLGIKS